MAPGPNCEIWKYFTNKAEEGMAECNLCKHRLKNNRSHNMKLHLKNIHQNTSGINKYFKLDVLGKVVECRICSKKLQKRLNNLRIHMRRSHNIEMSQPEDEPEEQTSSKEPNENQIKLVFKSNKRKMKEQIDNGEKRPTNRLFIKINKKTIIRSVIGLLVEDGVPLHMLSSKHFQAILNPMCEAISEKEGKEFKMDEAEIERIISLLANYIRNDFCDLHSRLLSLKIDTDLNASPNTFSISAQFVKDDEITKLVLGIINLKEDNDLKEDHIKQILYKFNIDSNQIISAFWDNTKHKCNKTLKNAEYLKEIERFQSYPQIHLGDTKLEPYLGIIAHLCLFDIFKNSNIFKKFLECRSMVKFLSDESNGYYELFDITNLTIPQLDSPWKAGSTYKMMNDLYEAQTFLKEVKFEKCEDAEDNFHCNNEFWAFVEAFCKSTIYLQNSILKFSNEELNIGDFYAQWLKCKLLTEKLFAETSNTNDVLCMILTETLKALETRANHLINQDRVAACLYLDPRFQRILNPNQTSCGVDYLKKLWYRAKLYMADDPGSNDARMPDEEDAFLNEFLCHDAKKNDREIDDVFQKIESFKLAFQKVDTNILSLLGDLKTSDIELYTLSTICFAIPATGIYNNMLYADVYQLDADSQLSSFTKDNLLSIRLNVHLFDAALGHLQLISYDPFNDSSTLSATEEECSDKHEDENSNTSSTKSICSVNTASFSTVKAQPSSILVSPDELSNTEFI